MQTGSMLNDDRTGVSPFGGLGAQACGGVPVRAYVRMVALCAVAEDAARYAVPRAGSLSRLFRIVGGRG
ncbi:hypothetical protein B5K11_34770 [Rhizobium leguminosarum bv. trifolii]|nr:hypothetical protein B5K11_34770 [Rhizobium leguminosarum bv. trifolii]